MKTSPVVPTERPHTTMPPVPRASPPARCNGLRDACWDSSPGTRWAEERDVEPTLSAAIQASRTAKPLDYMHQAGWVLIAFQNALYQLLHAPSLEEAVVNTVMQGGDTDTNAAICAALLGAVSGVDAIPEQWRRSVLTCRPAAGSPGVAHPRPKEYWPVDALELAADLVGIPTEHTFEASTVDLSRITRRGMARRVAYLPALTPGKDPENQFGLSPSKEQRMRAPKHSGIEIHTSCLDQLNDDEFRRGHDC